MSTSNTELIKASKKTVVIGDESSSSISDICDNIEKMKVQNDPCEWGCEFRAEHAVNAKQKTKHTRQSKLFVVSSNYNKD